MLHRIILELQKTMSLETKLSKLGKVLDSLTAKSINFIQDLFFERKKNTRNSKGNHTASSPYAILIFDSFIAFLSIFISIHLRIGVDFLDYSPIYIIKNMLVFGLVSASVFLWLQTHQSFWRYTSVEDMLPLFLSVALSNIIYFPLMLLMNQEDFIPYSVLTINLFVLSFMLIIPRFISRLLYSNKINKMKKIDDLTKVEDRQAEIPEILLIGSPSSVDVFLRDVITNDDIQFNFDPVGILSIDQVDIGRSIKGIPIIGDVRNIGSSIHQLAKSGIFPRQIVITERSIPDNMKKFLLKYVQDHGILLMHVFHQCTFNAVME